MSKRVKAALAAALIGLLGVSGSPACEKGKTDMTTGAAEKVYYKEYLADVCEELDCYYTVEQREGTRERLSPLENAEFLPESVATIDALVEKLRRDLPEVTVRRSTVRPQVIHLIETDLLEAGGYGMEQTVTLQYTGTPHGLTDTLGERLTGIGRRSWGSFPIAVVDGVTEISVDVKDQPVRDVLTEAVPLKGYSRPMWDARTIRRDGGEFTGVNFYGPEDPPAEDPEEDP